MKATTVTDMLGRTIREERPGFDGTVITNTFEYNSKGQLAKSTTPGQAVTLYGYDTLGDQTSTCQDVDGNDVVTTNGIDRISENDSYYEQVGSDWWRVSVSKIYATAGTNTITTNSIQRGPATFGR